MANQKSLKMVSTTAVAENRSRYFDLGERSTEIITGYFYDPMDSDAVRVIFFYDATGAAIANRVQAGATDDTVIVGMSPGVSATHYYTYCSEVIDGTRATSVARSLGWHKVQFKAGGLTSSKIWIDDVLVYNGPSELSKVRHIRALCRTNLAGTSKTGYFDSFWKGLVRVADFDDLAGWTYEGSGADEGCSASEDQYTGGMELVTADYDHSEGLTVVNNSNVVSLSTMAIPHDIRNITPALENKDDVRIGYSTGGIVVDIPRFFYDHFVMFKPQADIASETRDTNYTLYYGNDAAVNPPDCPDQIFLETDYFTALTAWNNANAVVSNNTLILRLTAGQIGHAARSTAFAVPYRTVRTRVSIPAECTAYVGFGSMPTITNGVATLNGSYLRGSLVLTPGSNPSGYNNTTSTEITHCTETIVADEEYDLEVSQRKDSSLVRIFRVSTETLICSVSITSTDVEAGNLYPFLAAKNNSAGTKDVTFSRYSLSTRFMPHVNTIPYHECAIAGEFWASGLKNEVYYTLNQSKVLYKSDDYGETGTEVYDFTDDLAEDAGFITCIFVDSRGFIYVSGYNHTVSYANAKGFEKIFRSTDDGNSFRVWLNLPTNCGLRHWGIDETGDRRIIVGAYSLNDELVVNDAKVWRSQINGYINPTAEPAWTAAEGQRHIHMVRVNPFTSKLYVSVGEGKDAYLVEDPDDTNFIPVMTDDTGYNLGLAFSQTKRFWGKDEVDNNVIGYTLDDNTYEALWEPKGTYDSMCFDIICSSDNVLYAVMHYDLGLADTANRLTYLLASYDAGVTWEVIEELGIRDAGEGRDFHVISVPKHTHPYCYITVRGPSGICKTRRIPFEVDKTTIFKGREIAFETPSYRMYPVQADNKKFPKIP